jgi:hypothetical protein
MSDTKKKSIADLMFTAKLRCNFPTLFQPRLSSKAKPGSKARYSITLMFDADQGDEVKRMKMAAVACAVAELGRERVAALLKENKLNLGIRTDGQVRDNPLPDGYTTYFQPWAYQKPGVVDSMADSNTGKPRVITDPNDIYSGCYVRAQVVPWFYDESGNKGVGWGLRHVQKLSKGDRLDNRQAAEDVFEVVDTDIASLPDEETPSGSSGSAASSAPPAETSKADLESLLG